MQKIIPVCAAAMFATSAFAQTTPAPSTTPPQKAPGAVIMPPPSATPSTSSPQSTTGSALTLTDSEAKTWVDKKVMSSDGKNLGEVAALARDTSGKVNELHADIGGFLGLGETRVRVMPSQFRMDGDHVVLNMTADQAKALPKVAK